MSLNLANDWKVVDDLQTLTYYVKQGEGSFASGVSVANTYWEELSQMDYLKRPDLLVLQTRAVHLWTNQLGTVTPKVSDKIKDSSSSVWYVDTVEKLDLDATGVQRYRCLCYLDTGIL